MILEMSNLYLKYSNHYTETERKYAPDKIFWEGDFNLLTSGTRVSVVGSRKVSDKGKIRTQIITETLVSEGYIVVSGLAHGVDTIAHQTAIANQGKTIAVLGTPLDKVYPKENDQLLENIKKNHLAVSQFPINYPVTPKNFPIRNRTMALISDATIIIEATDKSGTRHQAWEALRLGRQVFLMENIVKNSEISWVSKMIHYGAQVLTRDNVIESLNEIPQVTQRSEYAF
ncbi:DNA-processing protein DprA [Christiangramia sp. SM2212]|uniref:DNA-processing protein DprA n=1 Tax=Christiangramia sediminicola TaxID=3073267 RepID=A0ABU1ES45_9FLAO|nr:DNA-processing protein DprA [Christiangramia sp. SM2212]MDR5591214.1 DNA-processing protein DprA [Christiangramia sp. SM2212]